MVGNWKPWSACAKGKDGCVAMRWRSRYRKKHTTSLNKCSAYNIENMNCTCPSVGKVVASDWTTCVLNQILGTQCGKGKVLYKNGESFPWEHDPIVQCWVET